VFAVLLSGFKPKCFVEMEISRGEKKGENGTVGVIAGSVDYSGPAVLSSMAAYRTGADMVKTLIPSCISAAVKSHAPDIITREYEDDYFGHAGMAEEVLRCCDAVLIGPGLSEPSGTAVVQAVSALDVPVVVDAEAIKPCAGQVNNCVFTPHTQEYKSVESKIPEILGSDNVVLRTGPVDTVVSSSEEKNIEVGDNGMTVGGTGDVLAGVCASLAAQGMSKVEAAEFSARVCGRAGEMLSEQVGPNYLASDLVKKLPEAKKSLMD
jgi:NAD(P)H-hydrate epimerase